MSSDPKGLAIAEISEQTFGAGKVWSSLPWLWRTLEGTHFPSPHTQEWDRFFSSPCGSPLASAPFLLVPSAAPRNPHAGLEPLLLFAWGTGDGYVHKAAVCGGSASCSPGGARGLTDLTPVADADTWGERGSVGRWAA